MRFGAKWLQIGAFRCCYGVRRFLHCFARFLHVFCGKCGKLTGRGETAHGGRRELRWIARMRENMDIHNGAKISFERRNSRIFLTTIEPCMVMTRIAARKTSQFSRFWVYFAAILRDFRGKARIFRIFSPKMRKINRRREDDRGGRREQHKNRRIRRDGRIRRVDVLDVKLRNRFHKQDRQQHIHRQRGRDDRKQHADGDAERF